MDNIDNHIINSLDLATREVVEASVGRLDAFIRRGSLTLDMIKGKTVLDWECGRGALAVALRLKGAKTVVGSDTWLDYENTIVNSTKNRQREDDASLHDDTGKIRNEINGVTFYKGSISELIKNGTLTPNSFDLITANTVTEHLPDLALQLLYVNSLLCEGGVAFLNHHNYYNAGGQHDFGFVDGASNTFISQKSASCWTTEEKCDASKEHRVTLLRERPWTWNAKCENSLTPQDCSQCLYYKRSQPWGHLIYSDAFLDIYPIKNFLTGKPQSSLNKITLFQLRQFVIEAGFQIVAMDQTYCGNEPPEFLTSPPYFFTREELRIWMYRLTAVKKIDMSTIYSSGVLPQTNLNTKSMDGTIANAQQEW